MSISKLRGVLYRLARLLGDANAVEKGRVVPRVERRIVGRGVGRILGEAVPVSGDRVKMLLAPFTPIERVRPRRTNDPELLAFAGISRHGLRRLVEAGAIGCERSPAAMRKDGRRGASRIFITLADVAAWRAAGAHSGAKEEEGT